MFREIAIVAPGAMGSAIAHRLVEHGVRVTTTLEGRSAETCRRAEAAGMIGVERARLAAADVLLSIVPPGQAQRVAEEMAPVLKHSESKPIFVDCNAVNVDTVVRVGSIVEASGARFADAAIIGTPPVAGEVGPTLYVSGQPAAELAALNRSGLRIQAMDGPVGAASALKMSYAGITKGLSGIATAMILAADHAGALPDLRKELAASQSQLLQRFGRVLPDMFPKAYRWVAEMREIAAFASNDPATARLYEALADFFAGIAADHEGQGKAKSVVDEFLAAPRQSPPSS